MLLWLQHHFHLLCIIQSNGRRISVINHKHCSVFCFFRLFCPSSGRLLAEHVVILLSPSELMSYSMQHLSWMRSSWKHNQWGVHFKCPKKKAVLELHSVYIHIIQGQAARLSQDNVIPTTIMTPLWVTWHLFSFEDGNFCFGKRRNSCTGEFSNKPTMFYPFAPHNSSPQLLCCIMDMTLCIINGTFLHSKRSR